MHYVAAFQVPGNMRRHISNTKFAVKFVFFSLFAAHDAPSLLSLSYGLF